MRMRRSSLLVLPVFLAGISCSRDSATAAVLTPLAALEGTASAATRSGLWSERPKNALPAGFVPPTSLAPLIKEMKPAVVNISTTQVVRRRGPSADPNDPFNQFFGQFFGGEQQQVQRLHSLGSGFVINAKGLVVTNNHVIDGASEIKVKLGDGREFSADVVGKDPKVDLALLKLQGDVKDLPIVYLGDSDKTDVGDWVIAIGNPFGLDHTVSHGIVSAKERIIGAGPYDDFIQTDAPINPGNSGGPLFNVNGEVVGVNTAILSPNGQGSVGIGFAVPVNMLKEELPQLESSGHVVRGWLGVSSQDLTPELARTLKLSAMKGAVINDVFPDSPADKGGMHAGDVVTELNGRHVDNFYELLRAVAGIAPGTDTKVQVLREGKPVTLLVKVVEKPEDEQIAKSVQGGDRLGIRVEAVSAELARRTGLKEGRGVAVTDVKEDGAAYAAGVRPGDVILEVNRRPVESLNAYQRVVGAASPGDLVLLRVQRRGSTLYIAVRAS
ncbi:MAG: DegQ family serine endoprotease [Deltaproteobacteria bacterium]|nr:DegQ family serine endoprotease [Deltaproteobacteria bacterium]